MMESDILAKLVITAQLPWVHYDATEEMFMIVKNTLAVHAVFKLPALIASNSTSNLSMRV